MMELNRSDLQRKSSDMQRTSTDLRCTGNEQKRQAKAQSRPDLYRDDQLWRGMESFCKGIDKPRVDMQWHSNEIQSLGRAEIRKAERGNSGEKQGLAWRRKSFDTTGMDKHRDCDERKCIGIAKNRKAVVWKGCEPLRSCRGKRDEVYSRAKLEKRFATRRKAAALN